MKKYIFFAAIAVLLILTMNVSCKKELSCEACNTNSVQNGDKNKAPTAVAGPDQLVTLPSDSADLDGSSSIDPDGMISEWLWTKISGPASFTMEEAFAPKTKIKSLVEGIYLFELKVTDDKGLFDADTVQVSVGDSHINQTPIANAGANQTITLPTNSISVSGSGSTDAENNIISYVWKKIAGPATFTIVNANAMLTSITDMVEGVYQFELRVTDGVGVFSLDTMMVVVNGLAQPNRPPIANAGSDYTIIFPANFTIDGSGSSDPDNNIISYLWTKISGPTSFIISNANDTKATLTNLIVGIYQFELKVTDAGGLFSIDTVQIKVVNPPPACTDCRVVFVSNRDGNAEIYSCKADGSDIQRLTNEIGNDEYPVWSPDGTRIAFASDRTGKYELYVMNADGSNVVRKTFSGSFCANPSWSPDGTKIAYTAGSGSSAIWVVNANGGSPSQLFDAPGFDAYPAWSPDGTKIALVSDWAAYDFVYDIYTINADGSGFTALTGNIFDQLNYLFPSWSPNSAKIAMAISQEVGIDQYYTKVGIIDLNGNLIKAIKQGAAPWTKTSWSSDGTMIAFTSMSGSRRDVSWVSADGSASGVIVTNGWNADWQK